MTRTLKIYALIPEEKLKVCNHLGHLSYTGRMPCTGVYRCSMCGSIFDGPNDPDIKREATP